MPFALLSQTSRADDKKAVPTAVFAALLLSRTGVLPGRDSTVVIVATWVLVGVLALSTVANAVSGSRTERATMVPTGAVLTVAVLVIALGW